MYSISLLIPIFNAEPYLRSCLDSVIAQTYKDFEVILVDDGSTDASATICKEYVAIDSRIKYFYQPNGNEFSARNSCLEQSAGKYICWLDADDELLPRYIESLVHYVIAYPNADLVFQGMIKCSGRAEHNFLPIPQSMCFIMEDEARLFFSRVPMKDFGFCMGKLFRTSIIKSNNLHFSSKIQMGVDLAFLLKYISLSETIVVCPDCNYRYFYRQGAISRYIYPFAIELSSCIQIQESWKHLLCHQKGSIAELEEQAFLSVVSFFCRVLKSVYRESADVNQRFSRYKEIPNGLLSFCYSRSFISWLPLVAWLLKYRKFGIADLIIRNRLSYSAS